MGLGWHRGQFTRGGRLVKCTGGNKTIGPFCDLGLMAGSEPDDFIDSWFPVLGFWFPIFGSGNYGP